MCGGKGAHRVTRSRSAAVSFLTFNYDIRSCQVAVLLLGSDNPEGEGRKEEEEEKKNPGRKGEKLKNKKK